MKTKTHQQSLEFQLGFYVGEYIFHRFLPTLSTDDLRSRIVIKVSDEDTIQNKHLANRWFESTRKNRVKKETDEEKNPLWIEYYQHNKMLERKYLPHILKCHIPTIHNVKNIEKLKDGIIASLWDCDMCAYSLKSENITITHTDDGYFTVVEFVLGVTVNDPSN